MEKIGIAELPLHEGECPPWLFARMVKLSKAILKIISLEFGSKEVLKRLSNPYFFQSFGCVVGFDWHSSGLTTTLVGAIREALEKEDLGIKVCGGKGKFSLKTLELVEKVGKIFNFSSKKIEELKCASKLSAKVDNAVLQDGYKLYHHALIVDEKGRWCVIQQGMNLEKQYARRYHWFYEHVKSFVVEPHSAICCDSKEKFVLNLVSKKVEENRKVCVDLVKEGIKRIKRDLALLKPVYQKSLREFFGLKEIKTEVLTMPKQINWEALKKAYEFQPENYEELISIKGIGASTIKGLALVAQLIYGKPIDWKDPCKYAFAYGGKDRVPKPIDKKAMDESIKFLNEILEGSEVERKEKLKAFERLKNLASKIQYNLNKK